MSSPVEFRYYMRIFALDDLRGGVQPIRMENGRMFAPPMLQYRYKERIVNGGETSTQWSAWIDVTMVREGDEPFNVANVPVTPETIRQ